jgi:hypothetical protein
MFFNSIKSIQNNKNISYQRLSNVKYSTVPYVLNNANEVINTLRRTETNKIIMYGYFGGPSSTTTTPLKMETFAVSQYVKGFAKKINLSKIYNVFSHYYRK